MLDPVISPLRADFDFRQLVFLLIIFGPLLKRILEGREGTKKTASPKRGQHNRPVRSARRESTGQAGAGTLPEWSGTEAPEASGAPGEEFSWQDLLEGRAPKQASPATAPPPQRRPTPEPEPRMGVGPQLGEELVSETSLQGLPLEDALEVSGGDIGESLVHTEPLGDTLLEYSAGEAELVSFGEQDSALKPVKITRASKRKRFALEGGSWRRAIILNEVLGEPLGLRRSRAYPGPPSSLR